jgi:hypothetical protein
MITVQREPAMRREMGRRAAEFGKHMLWPEVGKKHSASFAKGLASPLCSPFD